VGFSRDYTMYNDSGFTLLSRDPVLFSARTLGGGSLTDVIDDDLRADVRLTGIYSDMFSLLGLRRSFNLVNVYSKFSNVF